MQTPINESKYIYECNSQRIKNNIFFLYCRLNKIDSNPIWMQIKKKEKSVFKSHLQQKVKDINNAERSATGF